MRACDLKTVLLFGSSSCIRGRVCAERDNLAADVWLGELGCAPLEPVSAWLDDIVGEGVWKT